MENVVNEINNLEKEMDLDDAAKEEPEQKTEEEKPKKENPYEGYKVSTKKILGWVAGIGALVGGICLAVKAFNKEEPTEEKGEGVEAE